MKKCIVFCSAVLIMLFLAACGGVTFFKENKHVPTPDSLFHEIKFNSEVEGSFQTDTAGNSVPIKWKTYLIKADSAENAKDIFENYLNTLSENYGISSKKGFMSSPIDNLYTLLLGDKGIGVIATAFGNDVYGMSITFDIPSSDDSDNTGRELSQDEAEARALAALHKAISAKEMDYSCDADQTRYTIATRNRGSSWWDFKGTVSLYDSYGQFRYSGTFDITIYDSGREVCDLDIQR